MPGYPGYQDMKIKNFGGLNTLLDPTNCPPFMSPDCLDVEFYPQTVKSRPPVRVILTGGGIAVSVNYIKTFVLPNGDVRTLWSDNLDNLFYEDVTNAPGVANIIFQGPQSDSFPNSITFMGKEYIAFGDGMRGTSPALKYDGTNLTRVSQDGPGAAPVASEDGQIWLLSGGANAATQLPGVAITSITQSGTTVTGVGASGFGFGVDGESVVVAGVVPAAYNGTFPVKWVPGALGQNFTYELPTAGLAPGAGGNVAAQSAKLTPDIPVGGFSSASPTAIQQALALGPLYFPIGTQVTVSGSSVGGYNGTWTVVGYKTWFTTSGGFNHYRLAPIVNTASTGLAAGTGGQMVAVGHITPGKHKVAVSFLTSDGYLTRPSPIATWTATGGKRVLVSDIPIGPPNVVARYLLFTPTESDDFFFIAPESADPSIPVFSTVIQDNTTTLAYFDFTDEDLLGGEPANDLFDLITLPPCVGFAEYKSRLVAVGALNPVDNFLNLSFDGGFTQDTPPVPLGWTPDAALYGGGGEDTSGFFGDAYSITGTGFGTVFGLMTQPATLDEFGTPILQAGKAYTLSAYFRKTAVMLGVTATISVKSASTAFSASLVVDVGTQVFISQWIQLSVDLPALPVPLPSDLVVEVKSENNALGETVRIDDIQFLPTDNEVQNSVALVSNAEDPESFNGITGILAPAEENGQRLASVFVIRDFLYLAKERSLFVTQDDEQSEPSDWSIDEVSQKVGTPSFRGVGIGDEWAIIGSESGAWFFTGGILAEENKLSTEVQPTWNTINWLSAQLLDVKVDTKRKRAYFAAPLGTDTFNSTVFTLDYTEGWSDATNSGGTGRKWAPWAVHANSMNQLLRQDNTLQFCLGGNLGDNNVRQVDPTALVGNPADSHWESGYFQNSVRLNFGYMTANTTGVGVLNLLLRRGDQSWFSPIRGWFLRRNTLGFTDSERTIQRQGYRMAIRIGTTNDPDTAALDSFMLQNLALYVREADYAPVRGINA